MTFEVVYGLTAEADVKEILDWYSSKSLTSATNFLSALRQTEERILRNPLAFLKIEKSSFRRAVIKRFPYCVYFRPDEDIIFILAVFHFGRSNRYKKKRLSKK